MIVELLIMILAVVAETNGVAICWYLIASLVIFAQAKFARAVTIVAIGGVLLDVLTPRSLGASSLVMLGVLLVAEKLWGNRQDKNGGFWIFAVALTIVEGIVAGRSLSAIIFGIACLLGILIVTSSLLSRSQHRQLIVRREI